jgi:L-fucose isomerase-like protein
MDDSLVLGVIVGNRGFFPGHLCSQGRAQILKVLEDEGVKPIIFPEDATPYGSVESLTDARKCAELFKQNRGVIDGVLVTLPNFGDERAVANTLRWAELNVPVLIHAFPDDVEKMRIGDRRDAFCGKISVCNNLHQYGIPFSLPRLHTVDPVGDDFREDLRSFMSVCRVVGGLKNFRVGLLGARPAAFNTVRFSEKILERTGISVETLDLSEVLGRAAGLENEDFRVKSKLGQLRNYLPANGVPDEALIKMAKFGAVVNAWMEELDLTATAIQCWTSLQENFGIVPCTMMSIMSNALLPSACETDIAGVVAMYSLVLASGKPSAILDWNNNYGDDPDMGVFFHCSNIPKDLLIDDSTVDDELAHIGYHEILAGTVGEANSFGNVAGRMREGPFTFCRVTTDDLNGKIKAYVGEGEIKADRLQTFGGYGVFHIPDFQSLLRFICENGFEHHVSISLSRVSRVIHEAYEKYLGWEVYCHSAGSG